MLLTKNNRAFRLFYFFKKYEENKYIFHLEIALEKHEFIVYNIFLFINRKIFE